MGLRVPEVVPRDRRGREHREAFGKGDARARLRIEELEERLLLGVIRARGIARRGADALIVLVDDRAVVEVLVGRVAPEVAADTLVEPLGERFGEPVRERFEQDGAVVVTGLLEPRHALVETDAGGHSERADPVRDRRPERRDVVGEREVGFGVRLEHLLADRVNDRARHDVDVIAIEDADVVAAVGCGAEEADDGTRREPVLVHDPPEHRARVGEQRGRRLAHGRVVEDRGVVAGELPGLEGRGPVDPRDEVGERLVERPHAPERRGRRREGLQREPVRARRGERLTLHVGKAVCATDPEILVLLANALHEGVATGVGEQRARDAHRARGIDHVDHRARVARLDAHRGVRPARRRAADEQRDVQTLALHLAGVVRHLFE